MNSYGMIKGAALGFCLVAAVAAADTAGSMVDQGNRYWADNKLDLAEQAYMQAITAEPESLDAHRQLASLYLSQNKTEQAIESYQTAITIDPDNAALFVGICLAYLHQGSFSRSHAMCSRALELDPELENAKKLQAYIDAKVKAINADRSTAHGGGAQQVPATVLHHE